MTTDRIGKLKDAPLPPAYHQPLYNLHRYLRAIGAILGQLIKLAGEALQIGADLLHQKSGPLPGEVASKIAGPLPHPPGCRILAVRFALDERPHGSETPNDGQAAIYMPADENEVSRGVWVF